jgi:putative aldouronate transport system permease protein
MHLSRGEQLFRFCIYVVLGAAGFTCVFPILHLGAMSISGYDAIASGKVMLWPVDFSLDNFTALFTGTRVIQSFINNVIITVVGVLLSMIFTILGAYPLSRKYCLGRRSFTLMIVFTMLFQGGLIPTFLLVRSLGLIDSYWAIWMLSLVSAFNLLIMRTFFQNVPEEIFESARMDGCGEWRMLLRMALPLSISVMATLTLFYAIHYWNAFMQVLIYINSSSKVNLTVMIQQMIRNQQLMYELGASGVDVSVPLTPEGIRAAGIIVLIVPMVLIYLAAQKYFVKGIMLGSVKG